MFPQDSLEDMMKPSRDAFEYWISFFPTAPLFGVEWRFGDVMQGMDKMMPGMDMTPAMEAMMPFANGAMGKPKPAAKSAKKPTASTGTATATAKPAAKKAAPAEKAATAPTPAAPAKADTKPVAPAKAEAVVTPKVATPKAATKPSAKPKAKVETKPAAKAPVKTDAKTPAKPAPKAKAKATAKDGKPASLLAEKPAEADDLKMIKGVGPGLEKELNSLGVYQFTQIAEFSKADLTWIDNNLTAFKGRCFRDDWIGQAKGLLG